MKPQPQPRKMTMVFEITDDALSSGRSGGNMKVSVNLDPPVSKGECSYLYALAHVILEDVIDARIRSEIEYGTTTT